MKISIINAVYLLKRNGYFVFKRFSRGESVDKEFVFQFPVAIDGVGKPPPRFDAGVFAHFVVGPYRKHGNVADVERDFLAVAAQKGYFFRVVFRDDRIVDRGLFHQGDFVGKLRLFLALD